MNWTPRAHQMARKFETRHAAQVEELVEVAEQIAAKDGTVRQTHVYEAVNWIYRDAPKIAEQTKRWLDWGGPRQGAGAKPLPPEEKARKTAISLSPDIFAKLEAAANETGRSRSRLIEEALRKFL